jgi:V8-like Glu-specific endopeptidase
MRTKMQRREQLEANRPMNMTTTHDITAGNSGSPVINRDAELVGLIFDGNIHSLGTSYWYDGRKNRAISVHADFIVEALRNVYEAERILKELDID